VTNILAIDTNGSLTEVVTTSATKVVTIASDGSFTEVAASGTIKALTVDSAGLLQEATVTFGAAWSPLNLTALSAWYDPSDFTTMWQDSSKTTPITAVNQPVGYIADKSGNGYHLTQPTSASRPTLKQDGSSKYYLENSSGTYLALGTNNLLNNISNVFVGYTITPTVNTTGIILVFEDNSSNDVLELDFWDTSQGLTMGGIRLPTDSWSQMQSGSTTLTKHTFLAIQNYASAVGTIYVDGSIKSGPVSNMTAGNTPAVNGARMHLGHWFDGGYEFIGNIYQVVIGHAISGAEIVSLNTFLNSK
jgi:hypothetical protein